MEKPLFINCYSQNDSWQPKTIPLLENVSPLLDHHFLIEMITHSEKLGLEFTCTH